METEKITECMKLVAMFEEIGVVFEYEADLDYELVKTPFEEFRFKRGSYYLSTKRDVSQVSRLHSPET